MGPNDLEVGLFTKVKSLRQWRKAKVKSKKANGARSSGWYDVIRELVRSLGRYDDGPEDPGELHHFFLQLDRR